MKFTEYKAIVKRQLNVDCVGPLHSFKNDLGADSFDMVELVVAFEDELGINLPDSIIDEDRVLTFYTEILEVLNFRVDI